MSFSRLKQSLFTRNKVRKVEETPGSAQIQSVEVCQLTVAAVAHQGRRKQGLRNFSQESLEPVREVGQHPAHQVGLDQAGRKEVVAARFPGGWIVPVAAVVVDASFDDKIG